MFKRLLYFRRLNSNSMLNLSKNKISSNRKSLLCKFQKDVGIRFKDLNLLDLAFHHRSFNNESVKKNLSHTQNNERLEFLGDAVLGMVTASLLYNNLVEQPEGELARIKSVVVSEMILSQIALNIGVDKCLVLGRGEELSGGRTKKAILADAMEAIIGAFYLDSGYREAEKFVLKFITNEVEKVINNRHQKDYKTLLQEWFQKKYKKCPRYELVDTFGPDHNREFLVQVRLEDKVFGPTKGKNKKEAEQAVAKLAWSALCNENISE